MNSSERGRLPAKRGLWWAIVVAAAGSALSCGTGGPGAPDASGADVEDLGNPRMPRSSLCELYATMPLIEGAGGGLCRPEAAEGEVCRFSAGTTGRCYGVGGLSDGFFASYERNNRVPKFCLTERLNEFCGLYPGPNDIGSCRPPVGECLRLPGVDAGPRFRCVPYHCNN
jgi:hypothetical protein